MTGPLKNHKHELFAQELAKGKSQIEAYENAGYKPDRGAATRLSANVSISARVDQLLERSAIRTEMTVASVTTRLLEIAKKAEKLDGAPGLSVARAAVMDAAKLNGLVVDTTESIARSPEERAERLAALRAERERITRAH